MLYNRQKEKQLKLLYVVYFAVGVFLVLMANSWQLSLLTIGKVFGFLALSTLPVQLVLASRLPFLEEGVGLDRIMGWHKRNGILMTVFALTHPTLMYITTSLSVGSVLGAYGVLSARPGYWFGVGALSLILITVLLTVYSRKISLDYEHWKWIHRVGYVIVLFGFYHSFRIGSDIVTGEPLFYWWLILGLVSAAAVVHRWGIRLWRFKDSWYKVINIKKEAQGVRSLYLEPLQGEIFNYQPGQFSFITLHSEQLPREEHHFTISSSPKHNPIRFTIKESGDFTSQLDKLEVGDKAKLEGPYGVFSNVGMKGPFLFIAGGIGITPIMSMLEYMVDTQKTQDSKLIFANGTRAEIAFKDKLDQLASQGDWLETTHVLSQEDVAGYYHGYVTKEIIEEVTDLQQRTVFLVGPPPMMEAVKETLVELRVPPKNIFTERFALR